MTIIYNTAVTRSRNVKETKIYNRQTYCVNALVLQQMDKLKFACITHYGICWSDLIFLDLI